MLAYMSKVPLCDPPILKDYIQPISEVAGADSDIIEGASRISLNCPISFRRIKTPVKGHNCKHHQCFDYGNFTAMNSRKPSWRCPSCNQPVSFIDLRIDQDMVKILEEVEEDVIDVEISADGSWKAVIEETENKSQRKKEKNVPGEHDSSIANDTIDMIMIEEDGQSQSENHSSVIEDAKPFQNSIDFSEQIRNHMRCNTLPSTNGQDTQLNPTITSSGFVHAFNNQYSLPILEVTPLAEMRELPSQFGSSIVSHEAERLPIARHVTRAPVAVQALGVPTPPTSSFKRMRVSGPSPSSDPLMTQSIHNRLATTPISSNLPVPSSATTAYQATSSANTSISDRLSHLRSLIMGGMCNRANSTLPLDASSREQARQLAQREQARQIAQRTQMQSQAQAPPSVNLQPQVSSASNVVPSINAASMPPLDKNWRPTGRMRGSLTGPAYSAALNQYAASTTANTMPQANSSAASKSAQGNTGV